MNQDKKSIIQLLEKMITPFFSENAKIDERYASVYDNNVIELEAFSRMLLGLGPLLYNSPNRNTLIRYCAKYQMGWILKKKLIGE